MSEANEMRWTRSEYVEWLYLEFWWAVHNLIAHPVSQLVWWISLCGIIKPVAKFGDWIHDWTVPVHDSGTGRG